MRIILLFPFILASTGDCYASSNEYTLEFSKRYETNHFEGKVHIPKYYSLVPYNYLNTDVIGTHLAFDLNNDFVNQTGKDSSSRFISSKKQAGQLKWYSMFTNLPRDMVSFYNVNITSKKLPLYAGIAVLTAGFMITDNQTWRASDKFYHSSRAVKSLSDIFVEVGDGRSQFGLAAAFAAFGLLSGSSRALRTASEIVEAVLASGAVVQVIKHITGRESPFLSTRPGGTWRFFPNQVEYHKHVPAYDAFPSGHLTTSLAAFVVIAENYPEITWIKPVAYVLESLLAVSMVNTGIHWYSDYPLAVALGYGFGEIVSHHLYTGSGNSSAVRVTPLLGPEFSGVNISFAISIK